MLKFLSAILRREQMQRFVSQQQLKTHFSFPISYFLFFGMELLNISGSCHKRQKPQAPTPQAPIRNRQTRKVANAKGLNRNTNLT